MRDICREYRPYETPFRVYLRGKVIYTHLVVAWSTVYIVFHGSRHSKMVGRFCAKMMVQIVYPSASTGEGWDHVESNEIRNISVQGLTKPAK